MDFIAAPYIWHSAISGLMGVPGVLQGVELLHLDLAGPHVDRHLREVRAVGHGGSRGDISCRGRWAGPVRRRWWPRMHQLIVRVSALPLVLEYTSPGARTSRSSTFSSICRAASFKISLLQLLSSHQRGIAAEEGAGGGVSAGIKRAGVRVAGNHSDAAPSGASAPPPPILAEMVSRPVPRSAPPLLRMTVPSVSSLAMASAWSRPGRPRALHDHGKALADLPVGVVGHFLLAPVDHVAALGEWPRPGRRSRRAPQRPRGPRPDP